MTVVLCYSGGLDSTVLLYQLLSEGKAVKALGFDYGQRHSRELGSAYEITRRLNVPFDVATVEFPASNLVAAYRAPVDEPLIGTPTVVPCRNLVFLTMASAFAYSLKADAVAIAAHLGDFAVYPDCRSPFLAAAEQLIRATYGNSLHFLAPFLTKTKAEIVALGKELRVPFTETWSCYAGEAMPCGKCGACIERSDALGDYWNQGMTFAKRQKPRTVTHL